MSTVCERCSSLFLKAEVLRFSPRCVHDSLVSLKGKAKGQAGLFDELLWVSGVKPPPSPLKANYSVKVHFVKNNKAV